MTIHTPLSATRISRNLRKAGFNPIGDTYSREGIRVRHGGLNLPPRVTIQIDSEIARDRMAEDVMSALTEMGYRVERVGDSVHVRRPA